MNFQEYKTKMVEAAQLQIDGMLQPLTVVRTLPLSADTVELFALAKEAAQLTIHAQFNLHEIKERGKDLAAKLHQRAAWEAGFQSVEKMRAAGYMVHINTETGEATLYHDPEKPADEKNREHG
jgi:hypothetical protein